MAKIGLVIGLGLAPFGVGTGLAATRGASTEAAVWFASTLLMLVAMPSLVLWASRRD